MTPGADPKYIVQCHSDVACPGGSLGSCPGSNVGIACSLLVSDLFFFSFEVEKSIQIVYDIYIYMSLSICAILFTYKCHACISVFCSFINSFNDYLLVYVFTFFICLGRLEFHAVRFTAQQQGMDCRKNHYLDPDDSVCHPCDGFIGFWEAIYGSLFQPIDAENLGLHSGRVDS